jgi:hypothetical protein
MTKTTMHVPTRTTILALAALSLAASSAPCSAQARDTVPTLLPFVSVGMSNAQRLPDGLGFHAGLGAQRQLGWRFGVRLEGTFHAYGEVPVYPCLFQDAERCYSTVDRQVTAGLLSLTYDVPIAGEIFYLVGGGGLYHSRRVASQYPACTPEQFCIKEHYRMRIDATQPGMSGGFGMRATFGTVPLLLDFRIHFASRTTPENTPSNDYFLMPITLSIGF